jgi:hypothetical protein
MAADYFHLPCGVSPGSVGATTAMEMAPASAPGARVGVGFFAPDAGSNRPSLNCHAEALPSHGSTGSEDPSCVLNRGRRP